MRRDLGHQSSPRHSAKVALALVVLMTLLVTLLLVAVSPPAAAGSPREAAGSNVQEVWQGTWSTTKIHGTIKLHQDGREVRGRYLDSDGDKIRGAKFRGEVKGRDGTKLVGEYECDGEGTFEIELTSGETFAGEYDPAGVFKRAKKWSGVKV